MVHRAPYRHRRVTFSFAVAWMHAVRTVPCPAQPIRRLRGCEREPPSHPQAAPPEQHHAYRPHDRNAQDAHARTSIAFMSMRVRRNGIFSGNLSRCIATCTRSKITKTQSIVQNRCHGRCTTRLRISGPRAVRSGPPDSPDALDSNNALGLEAQLGQVPRSNLRSRCGESCRCGG